MAVCIVLLLCLSSSLASPLGDYDEEAVFPTPADRQAGLALVFPQLGQSDAGPQLNRRERDGGSHHWRMVREEVDARMEDSGSSQDRIEDNALSRIREDHHSRASGSKHSRR